MKVRVLYHDHCFDGAASAAYITRFLRSKFYPDADFAYTGLAHRADQLFEDSLFDGDANVIVDFKYSTHPKRDLVVRSSPERVFEPGRRRAFPPRYIGPQAAGSELSFLHEVHFDGGEERVWL